MNGNNQFTRVKGISSVRRFPRLGKIRLGVKVRKGKKDSRCKHTANETCIYCTYPKETDYFVVPPEVEHVYGREPKELDIMFPVNDENVFFPQAYKFYGFSKGVRCIGNGEIAKESTEDGFKDKPCPCELLEKGKCGLRAHLMVILHKVNMGGVYQIDIGSYHSIVDINSGVDYVRGLISVATGTDRIALLPLKLKREPRVTYGSGSAQTHYTLKLHSPAITLDKLERLREQPKTVQFLLPEPIDINPVYDDGIVINGEAREITDDEPEQEQTPETVKTEPAPVTGNPAGSIEWYFEQLETLTTEKGINDFAESNKMVVSQWEDDVQRSFRKKIQERLKATNGVNTKEKQLV